MLRQMEQRNLRITLTAICGVGALVSLLSAFGVKIPYAVVAAYIAIATGGVFAVQSMWDSLRERQIDVNLLMVLAAAGAAFVGHPDDAAVLLFLFSLSSTLEAFAMGRTKSAIESLMKLRPDTAILVTADGEREVKVETLVAGDRIRIRSFDQIPVDALVEQGQSALNLSAITGESAPIDVTTGDRLIAGTQNLDGVLVATVQSAVGDTTLDKIVALVEDAQEHRASGERISRWFGQWYTIFVLVVFLVSLAVRVGMGATFYESVRASLTLLVALSPCALVISVPATTLSAMAWAAKNGMLVRGGEFIEKAGTITTIALDKTGTLTTGRPALKEICVCSPVTHGKCEEKACWHGDGAAGDEAKAMLRLAAAAEQYSTHPIADAIVRAAREQNISVPEALDQRVVPGMGIEATIDGKRVRIGQRRYFEDLPDSFAEHLSAIHDKGMTVAILEVEGAFTAMGLVDEPREASSSMIKTLRAMGIKKIAMMTGDNAGTAKAVAGQLELTELHAGLLPEDKTKLIGDLEDSGERVMMVGDGVNDAPALTRATVGVAMGGLGSDVALNAADVVLMTDHVERIPDLVRLGRQTNRTIVVNLVFAGGMIAALTLTSMTGQLPLPVAVLGHEGSTVLVILNGLRLLRGPSGSA